MCRSSKSRTCPATAQRAPSGRPAASRVTRWSRAASVTATVSRKDRSASAKSSGSGSSWVAHRARVTATDVIRPAPFPPATTAPATTPPATTAPATTAPGETAPATTAPGTTPPATTAPATTPPATTAPATTPPATTAPATTAPGYDPSGHHTAAPGLGRLNKDMYGHLFIKVRLTSIQGVLSRHAGATCRLPGPGRPDPERDPQRRIRRRPPAAHRGTAGGQLLGQQADRPAGDAGPGVGGDHLSGGRPGQIPGRRTGQVRQPFRLRGGADGTVARHRVRGRQPAAAPGRRRDRQPAPARIGRDLHRDARPAARRRPVLLHLGLPAAADRAAADRVRRAVRGGPTQPGDGHRADRRADERIHRRRGAERQRGRRSRVRCPAPGLRQRRAAASDRPPVLRRRGHPDRARGQLLRPRALLLPGQAPPQVAVEPALCLRFRLLYRPGFPIRKHPLRPPANHRSDDTT